MSDQVPPEGGSSSSSRPHESVQFPVKLVDWTLANKSLSTPILLQEKNGPCPLIALCNSLLLNNDFQNENQLVSYEDSHPKSTTVEAVFNFKQKLVNKYHNEGCISLQEILEYLGDLLLIFVDSKPKMNAVNIDEMLVNLPKLHTGLNVNPLLNSNNFQRELGTELFEIFGLKFKHGWVIDPALDNTDWNVDEYHDVVCLINQLENFDAVQDYLLQDDTSEEIAANKQLIMRWLNLNQTQLTEQGITSLNQDLNENEFIIFFRNNHFSTLFKKSDQEFYALLTDSSFVAKANNTKFSKIIWQSLNSISGNEDLFFTGDFMPILDIDQDLPGHEESGSDYLLLKQLQEEEDEKMAQRLQKNYNKRESKPSTATSNTPPKSKSDNGKKKSLPTTPAPAATPADNKNKDDKKKKKKLVDCIIT
ncbi:hypothetical protein SBY92_000763 [Candida maltosa Xu316]|uniref:MINDY deubiquitinase domain-containing protein n=1 Tax=Candida maltosa (strain Xu316) TaxID=1245528 RepID=M3IL95_CANMX|nr:hypothetical protein G210_2596 [Candida maltosa Xu316]